MQQNKEKLRISADSESLRHQRISYYDFYPNNYLVGRKGLKGAGWLKRFSQPRDCIVIYSRQ